MVVASLGTHSPAPPPPARRVRPPPPAVSSPVAAAANAGGQWLFCGELVCRPRQNAPASPLRSPPRSPMELGRGVALVRSRSAAGLVTPQPRRVALALRPLARRSPPTSANAALEVDRHEGATVAGDCGPNTRATGLPDAAPLRRCRSDQAAEQADAVPEDFLQKLEDLWRGVETSDAVDEIGECREDYRKKHKGRRRSGQPNDDSCRADCGQCGVKFGQCREVRTGRFLSRSRGMRHSRRQSLYAVAGAGAQRQWVVDAVDDVKAAAASSTAAVSREAELGEFLEKELSWCWKKFSTLDEPGTPRLLESELLCEGDSLAVPSFH